MTVQDMINFGAGILLSLLLSYVTPVSVWYYSLDSKFRGLVMLGLSALATLGIFGVSCIALFNWVPCTQESAMNLVRTFLTIVVASLGTYMTTPTSPTKLRLDAEKAALT
jgi:uncharacterized membrane protein (Fun14 family)